MAEATFRDPPAVAAWRHREARDGYEVCFFEPDGRGFTAFGTTAAVEDGRAWTVSYEIHLGPEWDTREAVVHARTAAGGLVTRIELDGGGWRVDGAGRPDLDGCLDVDLESSSMTNLFPVRRLALGIGDASEAPAVYVQALDLSVGRLEQRYERIADDRGNQRFAYESPQHDFSAELVYDSGGLVLEYPGIAVRDL